MTCIARLRVAVTDAAHRHVSTSLAAFALVAAIVVVEVGLRDPGPGMLVRVPTPGLLVEPIEQLRSVPLGRIDDPRAAAVASGVVFGRTDHVTAADEQAFLDSGLWHLLTGRQMARTRQCAWLLKISAGYKHGFDCPQTPLTRSRPAHRAARATGTAGALLSEGSLRTIGQRLACPHWSWRYHLPQPAIPDGGRTGAATCRRIRARTPHHRRSAPAAAVRPRRPPTAG